MSADHLAQDDSGDMALIRRLAKGGDTAPNIQFQAAVSRILLKLATPTVVVHNPMNYDEDEMTAALGITGPGLEHIKGTTGFSDEEKRGTGVTDELP